MRALLAAIAALTLTTTPAQAASPVQSATDVAWQAVRTSWRNAHDVAADTARGDRNVLMSSGGIPQECEILAPMHVRCYAYLVQRIEGQVQVCWTPVTTKWVPAYRVWSGWGWTCVSWRYWTRIGPNPYDDPKAIKWVDGVPIQDKRQGPR